MGQRIGVCSWSLRPSAPEDLVRRVREAGLRHVQLALDPLRSPAFPEDGTMAALERAGIAVVSGMMAFRGEDYTTLDTIRRTGGVALDEHWEENLEAARRNAALAERWGIGLVTFHAGFLPEEPGAARGRMLGRVRAVVDAFADRGVRAALETGQETAGTLLEVLDELDRPAASVNFDPANMILYGMGDPVEAARALGGRIAQVHIKDALPADRPEEWGTETPAGEGAVDWPAFFGVLHQAGAACDLMIERESGEERVRDVATARRLVEGLLGPEARA